MRRLAIFWLACAAAGFLAAVGAAFVLCVALDGAASWRAATPSQPRLVQRKASKPAPTNTPGGWLAPVLGGAD